MGTEELCRRVGISQRTLYRWKAKYGGMGLSDACSRTRAAPKRLVTNQALDVDALKDVLSNW